MAGCAGQTVLIDADIQHDVAPLHRQAIALGSGPGAVLGSPMAADAAERRQTVAAVRGTDLHREGVAIDMTRETVVVEHVPAMEIVEVTPALSVRQ